MGRSADGHNLIHSLRYRDKQTDRLLDVDKQWQIDHDASRRTYRQTQSDRVAGRWTGDANLEAPSGRNNRLRYYSST